MGNYQPETRSTDPNTTGWGTSQKGRLWYNSTSGVWKYWNGSAIKVITAT